MDGCNSLLLLAAAGLGVWRAWKRSGLVWFEFAILRGAYIYSRLWHRVSWRSPRPLPPTGAALLVSNHSCSADPNFLLAAWNRAISFLVAREHYHTTPFIAKVLDQLRCVQVVRTGADPGALRNALRRLAEGRAVCLFPEGGLSGVALNRLRRPKPGMALLALVSRAPVYPMFIAGGPRTDRLLPSWVHPAGKAARVHIGPPVDLSAYYDRPRTRKIIEEVATLLMGKIAALNPKPPTCCKPQDEQRESWG